MRRPSGIFDCLREFAAHRFAKRFEMQTFKDRLRGTTDRLRNLGGPTDALERRIFAVVDRATSEMMINPDWGVNMELVDIINTEFSPPCFERVCRGLRRRLWKTNPKIQILTLTLLETCVKNTGTEFHAALVKSDFWEDVMRLADPKKKVDLEVQDKVLILFEDCAHALSPPEYKAAYDALKKSGIRFPTRSTEEIGAGFNLPPTERDAQLMAGVSQEDQRAIQAALTDLSSGAAPPTHGQRPPPPSMETGGDAEKLRSDMRFVANSLELLKDALGSIPCNEPEMVHQDYIRDLSQQCTETVPRLKKLIEGATDEGVLAEALSLNDELGTVLQKYETMIKAAEDAKKPMAEKEQELSLLSFDDPVPVRAGEGTSTTTGDAFDALIVGSSQQPTVSAQPQQSPSDPFDLLAAESSSTPRPVGGMPSFIPPPPPPPPTQTGQQNSGPQKIQDPFDDLISL